MKKVIILLTLVFGIQSANAHITSVEHAHESLLHEWAWLLIPAIAAVALIWKFGKKKAIRQKS